MSFNIAESLIDAVYMLLTIMIVPIFSTLHNVAEIRFDFQP